MQQNPNNNLTANPFAGLFQSTNEARVFAVESSVTQPEKPLKDDSSVEFKINKLFENIFHITLDPDYDNPDLPYITMRDSASQTDSFLSKENLDEVRYYLVLLH